MLSIEKNILPFVVSVEETINRALQKINENKEQVIFAVDEAGVVCGVMTDGDFLRWLLEQDRVDLDQPITQALNTNFASAPSDAKSKTLEGLFTSKIRHIPLLDANGRLVAVAKKRTAGFSIGDRRIGAGHACFVIAEIGNNHNGDIKLAKKLVDEAVKTGADCAKFQLRHLDSLYHNKGKADDASEDLGSQYTLDLLSRFQLSNQDMFEVFDYCKEQGILPLCTPWDEASLAALEDYGMPAYKVASADLTNHDFLRALAATGKPLICSTGMSTESEIQESAKLLQSLGAQYALLHCNSTYPAPFKDIQLNYLKQLKKIGACEVGYSGHERDVFVAVAAVALGAKIIEKHFTLDKTMEGNDHKVSLLPEEFTRMVEGIRQAETALGTSDKRQISQGELINRETLAKSIVAAKPIQTGDHITEDMLTIKSPGKGLQPNKKQSLIGRTSKRDMQPGDFFFASDLTNNRTEARDYSFTRPWGVPVRYHDFRKILEQTNPDLLEFHLSYKDLTVDLKDFFDTNETFDLDFVVHAPELFAGDHTLDLTSEEESYRKHSVEHLQEVIDITRTLKKHFRTKRPCIITNVGGFSHEGPLPPAKKKELYKRLKTSLGELDMDGVEIIPQTMPPFPWHFGGQQYHNLFMDPSDIKTFCEQESMRVCFDVSHSKLACTEHGWSFKEFIETVGPYTAHLHIVDAEGVDGEGLQIGEGSIDFKALGQLLDETCPDASFIPEIWQGHKNDGEGFWIALDKLERFFKHD